MITQSCLLSMAGNVGMSSLIARAGDTVKVGIDGYIPVKFMGTTVFITDTHISLIFVILILLIFAIIANRVIKKADPEKAPKGFLNVVELLVETSDRFVISSMGEKHGPKFRNYIGSLFGFILLANLSGLLGLRPPTADYGTTLAMALMTFCIIHFNGFKYQKIKHITDLFHPVVLTPINIIGELATPLSMSLRLFGNVLSGTVLMNLIYGLLPKYILIGIPSFLHAYFDVFSGCIQTYVFCMLTMVFTAQNFDSD